MVEQVGELRAGGEREGEVRLMRLLERTMNCGEDRKERGGGRDEQGAQVVAVEQVKDCGQVGEGRVGC